MIFPTIVCPVCGSCWSDESEQANAVRLRGKCIVCVLDAGEAIERDPYEFALSDVAKRRIAFESWMMLNNSTASCDRNATQYDVYEVDLAWRAWQAAIDSTEST